MNIFYDKKTYKSGLFEKELSAFLTVEASFIVSWVIFLVVLLIYIAFYSYDRCILFQDAYAFAFRVSAKPLSEGEMQKYGDQKIGQQFGEKYIAAKQVQKSISVKSQKVQVKADLSISHPFSALDSIVAKGGWSQSYSVELDIMNPTKIVREVRKAENLVEMIR